MMVHSTTTTPAGDAESVISRASLLGLLSQSALGDHATDCARRAADRLQRVARDLRGDDATSRPN